MTTKSPYNVLYLKRTLKLLVWKYLINEKHLLDTTAIELQEIRDQIHSEIKAKLYTTQQLIDTYHGLKPIELHIMPFDYQRLPTIKELLPRLII